MSKRSTLELEAAWAAAAVAWARSKHSRAIENQARLISLRRVGVNEMRDAGYSGQRPR
jgi:predicted amidohydrolase